MFFNYFSFTLIPSMEIIQEWGPAFRWGRDEYSMEILRKPASEVTIHVEPEAISLWSSKGGERANFTLHRANAEAPVLLDMSFYNLMDFELKPESIQVVQAVMDLAQRDPGSIHPALKKTDAIPGYRRTERMMHKRWVFEIIEEGESMVMEDINPHSFVRLKAIGLEVLKWLYERELQIREIQK